MRIEIASLALAACTFDPPANPVVDGKPDVADAPIDTPACPASYVVLAGAPPQSRYERHAPSDFDTAKETCAASGGYVAIINDVGEADAIDGEFTDYPWINLSDAAAEGTWITQFGDPPPYRTWGSSRPFTDTTRNCATVDNRQLFDVPCARLYYVMCECGPR